VSIGLRVCRHERVGGGGGGLFCCFVGVRGVIGGVGGGGVWEWGGLGVVGGGFVCAGG